MFGSYILRVVSIIWDPHLKMDKIYFSRTIERKIKSIRIRITDVGVYRTYIQQMRWKLWDRTITLLLSISFYSNRLTVCSQIYSMKYKRMNGLKLVLFHDSKIHFDRKICIDLMPFHETSSNFIISSITWSLIRECYCSWSEYYSTWTIKNIANLI